MEALGAGDFGVLDLGCGGVVVAMAILMLALSSEGWRRSFDIRAFCAIQGADWVGYTRTTLPGIFHPELHPLFEAAGYAAGFAVYKAQRASRGDALSDEFHKPNGNRERI